MPTKKYKVQSGDSWIKIANKHGINLNQLFKWNDINPDPYYSEQDDRGIWYNPHRSSVYEHGQYDFDTATDKEQGQMWGEPYAIHPGQEIYISSPYKIDAAKVIADAPKNYIEYGDKGKQMLTNYALAVKQGKLKLNEVPSKFQGPVLQKTITLGTDEAASNIAQTGLNLSLFLLDPVGYTAGYAAQKGLAFANDKISGRNEYGLEDLFESTPIKGRQYAEEHPYRSAAIDFVGGAAGGTLLLNAPRIVRNAGQLIQNGVATTGLNRQVLTFPVKGKTTYGSKYQIGSKGYGKTGTVTRGPRKVTDTGSYRSNVSNKPVYNYYSTSNEGVNYITPDNTIPINPIGLDPALGPIHLNYSEPPVSVIRPKKHIFEKQSFNEWQQPMKDGWKMGLYQPGTGVYTITGHAPIGDTIYDQALTKESLMTSPNWSPRVAKYINNEWSGTPSSIFSGLGIEYNSKNPGNLIINKNE